MLILGGSGMIGSALRFELPRAGFVVEAPGRKAFDISSDPISTLPVHGFDYVVNAAGLTQTDAETGYDKLLLVNALFPHRLAERCSAHGVKLIQLSPANVFDGKTGLYTEETAPNTIDGYGRSKALGEPDRALVLRTTVVGPERAHFHNLLCRFATQQGVIPGLRNLRWTSLTSLQLARCISLIIQKGMYTHGIRHIPGQDLSHLELLYMLAKAMRTTAQPAPEDDGDTRDFRLSSIYPDFLRELQIPPMVMQVREMAAICDSQGRWLQVFVNHEDLERADRLHRSGNLTEAELAYRSLLDKAPDYVPALVNLGVVLSAGGRNQESIRYYQHALTHDPQNAIIHNNLGNAFQAIGRSNEAAAALRRAVAIDPNYEKAYTNLGDALFNEHRFDEARAMLEKALELNPQNALSWNRLGRVHTRQCRTKEGIKCYRKAVELQPNMAGAHSNVVFTMHFLPDYSPEEIAAEHRRWNDRHARPLAKEVQPFEPRDPDKKPLRIGFVSDCFRRHPVGDFLNSLFRERDRNELEFVCYSDVLVTQPMTEWFKSESDQWRDIGRMSDADVTELIRRDEIDILVDLAGHTGQNRLLVFARKPAPVQATWMGYVNTTGMDAIDYIIADRHCVREEEDHLYRKK